MATLDRLINDIIVPNLPSYADALLLTLQISIIAIVFGFVLGVVVGLGRTSTNRPIRWLCTVYVEVIRGTPLLVQIFIVYFGLPSMGINLDRLTSGILAIGFNSAAYQAEIIRAGIQSIPVGQMEAARAIGMTRAQAMKNVILPQALRLIIPPMTNEFITLIKDSSLVSVLGVIELTKLTQNLNQRFYEPLGLFLFLALIYLILTYSTSHILRYVEKKYAIPGYEVESK